MSNYFIYICPNCLTVLGDLEFEKTFYSRLFDKNGKFKCPSCKKSFNPDNARRFLICGMPFKTAGLNVKR